MSEPDLTPPDFLLRKDVFAKAVVPAFHAEAARIIEEEKMKGPEIRPCGCEAGANHDAGCPEIDREREARVAAASPFAQYRRKQIAELRPYIPGETLNGVSISAPDTEAGSPKLGDMVARNPKNHADQWLVAAQYFADNFEGV